jgi:hypothetical protein
MKITGTATLSMQTWDEKPYTEVDGDRKLTRTQATFAYTGDLEAAGAVEYLMAYCPGGLGNFVGLERIVGRLGARTGSFVVQHTGTFEPTSVNTRWEFVPGSGTGELEGLSGGGELVLSGHGPYNISFEYELK